MKIEMALRAAQSQDMPECAAIVNDWIDQTNWMPRVHSHDDVLRHYQKDVFVNRKVHVVAARGRIAGMMALDQPAHMVTALYVGQGFRGQGVGTKLLDLAKVQFRDCVQLYTFQANEGAQRFYFRHGFREVNRTDGDNEESLPDILLEWRSTSSGKGPR